ncbi:peptidoglycan-binding protein [Streptomyces sp. NBC_01565]|uniref:peptidoglycan-binding protein n=1 Tax=Streptomyces sp. NBC_01565 TaxID=2975881 RepID=UPI00224E25CE|nr:peptidoglycan-binding protein [Streptomyces sp. NBC_01565]MCX4547105.1 peptidoglycan-binding protein [Streptomyces sp. NBC_01565]
MSTPQWRQLTDHLMSVTEKIYEGWNSRDGWDNYTQWGREFGENGVPWCVIFDWCMYHDVGLDSIVPKVDNVTAFTAWAKERGQWSAYPSVGAWVNFGNGAHTEIVTGFDSDTVYTKGGNSIQAGASDHGQGNGVWSHSHPRRSDYVTGYFAPTYPDGQCPPTADPHDPRGGAAVASWRWTPPAPAFEPFPGTAFFARGRRSPVIAAMHARLVAVGCDRYQSSANTDVWGSGDENSYKAWQQKLGYTGTDADGIPGPTSWAKLQVPNT